MSNFSGLLIKPEVSCVQGRELRELSIRLLPFYENVKDGEVKGQTAMHEVHMWG